MVKNLKKLFAEKYLKVHNKPWVPEPQKDLLYKVAKQALMPGALRMEDWHTCDSTHCIAGWAIYMTEGAQEVHDDAGLTYEKIGWALLGKVAAKHFYNSNEDATKYLEGVVERHEKKHNLQTT